jgi:uncharacterized protein YuzE
MPTDPTVSLQIDTEAGAAYLRLNHNPVARTCEFTETVLVDLDVYDVVVGIEILDLGQPVALDELAKLHHIDTPTLVSLVKSINWGNPSPPVLSSSNARPTASIGTLTTA